MTFLEVFITDYVLISCIVNHSEDCFKDYKSSPKLTWEECVALAQLRKNVPLVTMGRPKFIPKLPLLLRR